MALLPNALSCHFHSPIPHKRSPDRSGKISFISSFLSSTVPFLLRPQIPNPNPSFSLSLSLLAPLAVNSGTSPFSLKPTSPRESLV
uniref:Uncharacterized protein n=1 Tax=Sus scrofa TaxID=9823 RepID=A0A8W4FKZ9_PIG